MNKPSPRRALFHRAIAVLVAALAIGAAPGVTLAAPPLQSAAQPIQGEFLRAPGDLKPPTDFSVAEQAPAVEFAVVPLPETPADPWSIWGYGLLHSNGKFYVPVGDHMGVGANAYLYEYDPQSKVVRQVADVQSAVKGYTPTEFGFGKIHGRLSEGPDGKIYFATYWGQWRTESEHYHGERIFQYDPRTAELEDLGMPLFGWGYPSTHMATKPMLLYAEAHQRKGNSQGDPNNQYIAEGYGSYQDPYHVKFFVYDLKKREVIFHGAHEGLGYGRDFFVDIEGNAYWNSADSSLEKYDVATNTVSRLDVKMPGTSIRRTVGPDASGMMYGVTHDTHQLFSFDPKTEKIRTITTTWADSPGMDVVSDGKYAYYVPGGHGPSSGTPLIQVALADGSQKVIGFLHASVWEQTQFNLGGTYCLQISDDGSTVYIGFNGIAGTRDEVWGDLAVVAVHIPESER